MNVAETNLSHKVFGKDIFQQATIENKIYLAILGNLIGLWIFNDINGNKFISKIIGCIFDVTKGKKYYQPDGSYSFFAGDSKKKIIIRLVFKLTWLDLFVNQDKMPQELLSPEILRMTWTI